MKQSIAMGRNRTGLAMHPLASRAMLTGAEDLQTTSVADGEGLQETREEYATSTATIGTMPPPSSVRELLTTAVEGLKGHKAIVLVDALGDRLAYERTGFRLYEAMIAKVHALGSFEQGPSLEELERIRDEELAHFAMLYRTVEQLGGDPTLQTPTADVSGVLGMGLVQVLNDPRTTVPQALHALHVAELVDNDAWLMLAELARSMGHTEMAERFVIAEAEEAVHLQSVRGWLRAAKLSDAAMSLAPTSA